MNETRRAPGWWYPWIFVGGMLLVVVVNGVLVYFALGSWTGLETDDHYRKGLAYNEDLAAAAAQEKLGWRTAVTVTPAGGDREFDVAVAFTDAASAPLDGLTVHVAATRPTSEGHDASAALSAAGGGAYTGRVRLALPGLWDVRVIATGAGGSFQSVERIQVK